MLMKLSDIIQHYKELTAPTDGLPIIDRAFPSRLSFALGKNVKKFEEEVNVYNKEREKICDRLAEKDENGKAIIVEDDGQSIYKMSEEAKRDVNRELAALYEAEIDIPIQKIDEAVIEQCDSSERYHGLSARDLLILDFMIEGGNE